MEAVTLTTALNGAQSRVGQEYKAQQTAGSFWSSLKEAHQSVTESMDDIFEEAASVYGISVDLLKAVAKAESNFNPNAISRAGAQGVMQLMPGTARTLGVTDPFDARQNIMGGAKYLKQNLERFNGDVSLALAAYNAGPGSVEKYGGIPPYAETQNYVKKVFSYLEGSTLYANTRVSTGNHYAAKALSALNNTYGTSSSGSLWSSYGSSSSDSLYNTSMLSALGTLYGSSSYGSLAGLYGSSAYDSLAGLYGSSSYDSLGSLYGSTVSDSIGSSYDTSILSALGSLYGSSSYSSYDSTVLAALTSLYGASSLGSLGGSYDSSLLSGLDSLYSFASLGGLGLGSTNGSSYGTGTSALAGLGSAYGSSVLTGAGSLIGLSSVYGSSTDMLSLLFGAMTQKEDGDEEGSSIDTERFADLLELTRLQTLMNTDSKMDII